MTSEQYKALEAHISFWGALVMANVVQDKWLASVWIVGAVICAIRHIYWHRKTL